MKPFFILKFKASQGNQEAVYQRAGANATKYATAGIGVMESEDFICNGDWKVSSILRCEAAQQNGDALPRGTVFSINDFITHRGHKKKITSITIINGLPVFGCVSANTGEAVANVLMADAALFVEPLAQPVAQANPARIAEIERQIIAANPRALRIQGLLKRRTETLQEFVQMFFEEFNNTAVESGATRNTVYVDTDDLQTLRGKRRSLGDLFMIFKYYYPTCTLKDVAKLLYVTLPPLNSHFSSCKCTQIHKRVWFYDENRNNEYKQANEADEYGLTRDQWRELLA